MGQFLFFFKMGQFLLVRWKEKLTLYATDSFLGSASSYPRSWLSLVFTFCWSALSFVLLDWAELTPLSHRWNGREWKHSIQQPLLSMKCTSAWKELLMTMWSSSAAGRSTHLYWRMYVLIILVSLFYYSAWKYTIVGSCPALAKKPVAFSFYRTIINHQKDSLTD